MMLPILLIAASTFMSLCVDAKLLHAIKQVESGGSEHPLDGDHGKAIGPYQIHFAYWKDATDHDKTIGGKYSDCRRSEYAERIVRAYMDRYAPAGASDEVRARIHNGGPRGHKKLSTLGYWEKVKKVLK